MGGRRSRVRGVALTLLYLAIPLVVLEVVGRNLIFRGGRGYFFRDVDHRMEPHSRPGINSDGIRSRREAGDFRPEDVNVVFLGDSFVYGLGLTPDESIPQLLEDMARSAYPERRIQIANFGWISASPLLSLRQLRDLGPRYHPDTVLLGLDMTDFHDDLKYRRLLERPGVFAGLSVAPTSIWILRKLLASFDFLDGVHTRVFGYPAARHFAMTRPLDDSRRWLSETEAHLEAIHEFATTRLGARFILFVFPRSFQYSDREAPDSWLDREIEDLGPHVLEPFVRFDELRDEVGFPIHSLLPDFQHTRVFPTCFRDDSHWNADGARVAAEAIFAYCRESGCFEEGSGVPEPRSMD